MERTTPGPEAFTHPPLIDGHTHIDQYDAAEIPALLERARGARVGGIIAAGTTLASCDGVQRLAEQYPFVRTGVGLHPADLTEWLDNATEARLRELAQHPSVVVWSETGLDYLASSPAWDLQQDAFRKQIRLAKEFDLPLVIHSREADSDTVRILKEENAAEAGGAWHYFQGDITLAEQAMQLGFLISLAKPLLRLPELQDVASRLPLDRIVIETDSYPQPFKKYRERWTEPWHLHQVAEKLAELQGVSVERVAEATTANELRMLRGRFTAADLTT